MSDRPVSPDCRDGKCGACHGEALDEATDEVVQCAHGCHTFQRINDDIAERPSIESWWV